MMPTNTTLNGFQAFSGQPWYPNQPGWPPVQTSFGQGFGTGMFGGNFSGNYSGRGSSRCFNCGGFGHKKDVCPNGNTSKVRSVVSSLLSNERRKEEKEEKGFPPVLAVSPVPSVLSVPPLSVVPPNERAQILHGYEANVLPEEHKEEKKSDSFVVVVKKKLEEQKVEEQKAVPNLTLAKQDAQPPRAMLEDLKPFIKFTYKPPDSFMKGEGLGRFLEKNKAWFKKKSKEMKGKRCKFCKKKGHEVNTCPNFTPKSERDEYLSWLVEQEEQSSSSRPDEEGKQKQEKQEEVLERMKRLGKVWNEKNPWKDRMSQQYANRLRSKIGYWKAMGVKTNVLTWLYNGIKTKFVEEPERKKFKNCPSYYKHIEFVHKEVMKHLQEGSFEIIPENEARVINPIHVVEGRKLRMCVDSRYPNLFTPDVYFRVETAAVAAENLVNKEDHMFSVDLEKAYYCIPLHESIQAYFCFSHLGMTIKPKVLVFGYKGAPFYFNKVVREMMKTIRGAQIRSVAYFDDLMFILRKEEEKEVVAFVKELLDLLGWVTNDKSIWEVTKRIEYLGVIIDSAAMKLFMSETKKKKIMSLVNEILNKLKETKTYQLKQLASLLGKLSWAAVVVKGTNTWTRELDTEKNRETDQNGWERMEREVKVRDDEGMIQELEFWQERLEELSVEGQPIREELRIPSIRIKTDSSEEGWGAIINGEIELAGTLREAKKDSSTIREMMAVEEVLNNKIEMFAGKTVEIRMDSQALSHILIKKSSRKKEIHQYVKRIWMKCYMNKIDLRIKWIPREFNKEADLLSRVFVKITKEEMEQTVELAVKNGWSSEDEKKGQEQLGIKKPDLNWIPKALKVIRQEKKKTIIIVPEWKSALWWPIMFAFFEAKIGGKLKAGELIVLLTPKY
jgi:hypothetical protein